MADEHPSLKKFNAALNEPDNFQSFAADPAGFAKGFGLKIAPDISTHIAGKLQGGKSLASFIDGDGGSDFTAAAVAMGAAVSTDTKIAAIGV